MEHSKLEFPGRCLVCQDAVTQSGKVPSASRDNNDLFAILFKCLLGKEGQRTHIEFPNNLTLLCEKCVGYVTEWEEIQNQRNSLLQDGHEIKSILAKLILEAIKEVKGGTARYKSRGINSKVVEEFESLRNQVYDVYAVRLSLRKEDESHAQEVLISDEESEAQEYRGKRKSGPKKPPVAANKSPTKTKPKFSKQSDKPDDYDGSVEVKTIQRKGRVSKLSMNRTPSKPKGLPKGKESDSEESNKPSEKDTAYSRLRRSAQKRIDYNEESEVNQGSESEFYVRKTTSTPDYTKSRSRSSVESTKGSGRRRKPLSSRSRSNSTRSKCGPPTPERISPISETKEPVSDRNHSVSPPVTPVRKSAGCPQKNLFEEDDNEKGKSVERGTSKKTRGHPRESKGARDVSGENGEETSKSNGGIRAETVRRAQPDREQKIADCRRDLAEILQGSTVAFNEIITKLIDAVLSRAFGEADHSDINTQNNAASTCPQQHTPKRKSHKEESLSSESDSNSSPKRDSRRPAKKMREVESEGDQSKYSSSADEDKDKTP